jgi:hypothetical protein
MRIWGLGLLILVLIFFGKQANAADFDRSQWDKRIALRGGVIRYNMSGDFSSNKDDRPNYNIDLGDLGLDDDGTTVFLNGSLRLGERWRLQLDYFGYHEDATKRSDFEFEFDDVIIPVGATIDSKFDIDLYVVNLSYDIYQTNRAQISIGLGAHVADLDLKIAGNLRSGDNTVPLGVGDESILAPLPNLFVAGTYALKENLILNCAGGWMSLSYGNYKGDLVFARGILEYWPFEHIGIGGGYIYTKADIDYDPNHMKENYDIKMPGPVAYLAVGF